MTAHAGRLGRCAYGRLIYLQVPLSGGDAGNYIPTRVEWLDKRHHRSDRGELDNLSGRPERETS
jgi:hypothetical protein